MYYFYPNTLNYIYLDYYNLSEDFKYVKIYFKHIFSSAETEFRYDLDITINPDLISNERYTEIVIGDILKQDGQYEVIVKGFNLEEGDIDETVTNNKLLYTGLMYMNVDQNNAISFVSSNETNKLNIF
jgi:hypothetical protein